MPERNEVPLPTLHLMPLLHRHLIDLLHTLTADDWTTPTVARLWTVKDVAAHLLDGNLRGLSTSRDGHFADPPTNPSNHKDLVAYLNELNASWVKAARRLSPATLIDLLDHTGKQYIDHLTTLDPFADAVFPVDWAGQSSSPNWFHIAREYTEKFLHQQQIRDALGRDGLLTRELFHPFIATFFQGLPHAYRNITAPEGTLVQIRITTEIGGDWHLLRRKDQWVLTDKPASPPAASISLAPNDAWKLFSKSRSPEAVRPCVTVEGREEWALPALSLVSVMA